MKFYLTLSLLFMKSTFLYAVDAMSSIVDPDSILIKVSQKINSLKNIRYTGTRELNYSSEHYHHLSTWDIYYDFQPKDTLIGFKYQIADSTSKQFFNGTEKFDLDIKLKTISINDHPDRKIFSGLSALYNSIITLKNALPLLIIDKTAQKYVSDTTISNTSYAVITINIGKRRIQNLGFGFDAMTTKSDFIYKILIEKNSYLPFEILQINDLNSDFIKTRFTSIETNTTSPAELSWYYSTYTNEYKFSEQSSIEQLLSPGASAPDWKLQTYNTNTTLSLSELKGQVILLDFWIKNCGPCIQSVPHLKDLQNKFKGKNFKLISINSYDSKEDINWFCDKHAMDYPVLLNGKSVAEQYGVTSFPTFFIIDKSGKIIYANRGYSASTQSEIERIIKRSL